MHVMPVLQKILVYKKVSLYRKEHYFMQGNPCRTGNVINEMRNCNGIAVKKNYIQHYD